MERTAVQSSNIASIGYNQNTSTLQIEFNSGRVYEYYDVPDEIHQGLVAAGSAGSYFHSQIKNSYAFQEI